MEGVEWKKGGSWRMDRLGGERNLLNRVRRGVPGVNRPYLYFGTWKVGEPRGRDEVRTDGVDLFLCVV